MRSGAARLAPQPPGIRPRFTGRTGGAEMKLTTSAIFGAVAGAAGTTAINVATYSDMVARGRPASSTPQETIDRLAHRAHVSVPGEGERRGSRLSGMGALGGIGVGVAIGTIAGLARWAGWRPRRATEITALTTVALIAGNAPAVVLDVTHPSEWDAKSWLADLGPHLAYGAATAAVLDGIWDRA